MLDLSKMFFLKSKMAAFLLPSLNWPSASKFTCFVVCICTLVHGKFVWYFHTGKFVNSFLRDRSKIRGRGGGGLVQTWGGPWFFMQAQKGGSNNLVHVIKGGPFFFMQRCWGQGVNLQFFCSHSHSLNTIWNTFFI